jgi:hypothetical protein
MTQVIFAAVGAIGDDDTVAILCIRHLRVFEGSLVRFRCQYPVLYTPRAEGRGDGEKGKGLFVDDDGYIYPGKDWLVSCQSGRM